MKKTANLRTLAIAMLMTGLTVGVTLAQQVSQVQAAVTPAVGQMGVTTNVAAPIGTQQIQSIEKAAYRDRVASQLAAATASLQSSVWVDIHDLAKNGNVQFTAPAGKEVSVAEQHLLNVVVHYDARPIGGILTVRAELVPAFSGIGTACRPVISKQFSQAVDNLDDDIIAASIKQLTDQIGHEYAAH